MKIPAQQSRGGLPGICSRQPCGFRVSAPWSSLDLILGWLSLQSLYRFRLHKLWREGITRLPGRPVLSGFLSMKNGEAWAKPSHPVVAPAPQYPPGDHSSLANWGGDARSI
jgi:hypothetical protein